MHVSFLDYLVDPLTKTPLELEAQERKGDVILEGRLISATRSYPIVRGIPRFAGYGERDDYLRSFSYQWNKWSRVQFESENENGPMRGHTLGMWEKITSVDGGDMENEIFADFGCGSGRFIDVVRRKRGRVIGLDLSYAVEAASQNFEGDPGVLICQADVLNPPIKRSSMDGAFSIGVFHHTPHPRIGFAEMANCVAAGGWVAVAVYGKGGYYDFPTVRLYRGFFKLLWPLFRHYPPLFYSYLAAYVLRPLSYVPLLGVPIRAFFPFVRLPDPKWSLLDTFDSLTPTHQSAHTSFEVYGWLKENGIKEIAPSDWGFTAYHGIRG